MIRENYTEAWGYIATAFNRLEERVEALEKAIPHKKTPEELKAFRVENLKKARAAKK